MLHIKYVVPIPSFSQAKTDQDFFNFLAKTLTYLLLLLPHLKERYNYNYQNSADHPKLHLDDLDASV